MLDANATDAILSNMASAFNDRLIPPDNGGPGWGQFLDVPRDVHQLGPYGTCAGIIVNSAAAGPAAVPDDVAKTIERYWIDWVNAGAKGRYFVQTTRLAFLLLTIRLSGHPILSAIQGAVEAALIQRKLPTNTWGDWWIDRDNYDRNESPFITALVVIAFSLDRHTGTPIDSNITAACDALLQRASGSNMAVGLPIKAALAAVSLCSPEKIENKNLRTIRQLTRTIPSGGADVYFFDYNYFENDQRKTGRDFFVAPSGFFEVLMLGAVRKYRLEVASVAEIVQKWSENIRSGMFQMAGSKAASVDQSLIAVALKYWKLNRGNIAFRGRLRLWFRKNSDKSFWLAAAIPSCFLVLAGLLSVYPTLFTWANYSFGLLTEQQFELGLRATGAVLLTIFGNPSRQKIWRYISTKVL